MKILLINISLRRNSARKIFPIGLGFVATAIDRGGYKFDLLDIDAHKLTDLQIYDFLREKSYDVVCVGCVVTGYHILKPLLKIIRNFNKNCKIIVGNSVASSISDILLNKTESDIAVVGEGDETIVDLLKTISAGEDLSHVSGIYYKKDNQIVKTKKRETIKNISDIPLINFDLFDVQQYISASGININESSIKKDDVRMLPITTARGCVAKCTFCYHVFKEDAYRHRTPENIVYEMAQLKKKYNINYVQFLDDLTFYSKHQVEMFCKKLIDENLGIKWSATCRSNLFINENDFCIVKLMRDAGCEGIQYSLENADQEILKMMNKKCNPDHFSKQSSLFHRAGITTWTSLVFGYPQETKDSINKTFDVCIENRIYPSVGYLLPQPGSVMYDYAKQNGFIGDDEEYILNMGERQDLKINMTKMTNCELEECVVNGLKRCNAELNMGLDENNLIKTGSFKKNKNIWF